MTKYMKPQKIARRVTKLKAEQLPLASKAYCDLVSIQVPDLTRQREAVRLLYESAV
jgi:hypothetical protein